jgi:hypothetical protein
VSHEVYVLCACDDIEQCRTEVYVSDVRILKRRLRMTEYALAALIGFGVGLLLGSVALAAALGLSWVKWRWL